MAKARKAPKAPPPGKATRRVSPAKLPRAVAQVALDRATARIKGLQRDVRANAWKIGRELTQVSELELFRARGHDTFERYVDEVLGLSRDGAYQLSRVAEAYAESMVVTFGVEKLDRLLRYFAATPERDGPEDVPTLVVRVPKEGGGVTLKPFASTSLLELRAAIGAETAAAKPGAETPDVARTLDADAALEVQGALVDALDDALGRAAEGVEVRVSGLRSGPTMSLKGVPLEGADAALAALRKALKRSLAEVWTEA